MASGAAATQMPQQAPPPFYPVTRPGGGVGGGVPPASGAAAVQQPQRGVGGTASMYGGRSSLDPASAAVGSSAYPGYNQGGVGGPQNPSAAPAAASGGGGGGGQQPANASRPSSTGLIRLTLRKPMGIVFEPMPSASSAAGAGPKAPGSSSQGTGVRICDLPRTGAAALSRRLEVGDELLSINDVTMSRLAFDEIMDFIIAADPESVHLLFRRPKKDGGGGGAGGGQAASLFGGPPGRLGAGAGTGGAGGKATRNVSIGSAVSGATGATDATGPGVGPPQGGNTVTWVDEHSSKGGDLAEVDEESTLDDGRYNRNRGRGRDDKGGGGGGGGDDYSEFESVASSVLPGKKRGGKNSRGKKKGRGHHQQQQEKDAMASESFLDMLIDSICSFQGPMMGGSSGDNCNGGRGGRGGGNKDRYYDEDGESLYSDMDDYSQSQYTMDDEGTYNSESQYGDPSIVTEDDYGKRGGNDGGKKGGPNASKGKGGGGGGGKGGPHDRLSRDDEDYTVDETIEEDDYTLETMDTTERPQAPGANPKNAGASGGNNKGGGRGAAAAAAGDGDGGGAAGDAGGVDPQDRFGGRDPAGAEQDTALRPLGLTKFGHNEFGGGEFGGGAGGNGDPNGPGPDPVRDHPLANSGNVNGSGGNVDHHNPAGGVKHAYNDVNRFHVDTLQNDRRAPPGVGVDPNAVSASFDAAANLPFSELEYNQFDAGDGADVSVLTNNMSQYGSHHVNVSPAALMHAHNYVPEAGKTLEESIQTNPERFYRHVVSELLSQNEPEKIRLLDKLLAKYQSREEHLIQKLTVRYREGKAKKEKEMEEQARRHAEEAQQGQGQGHRPGTPDSTHRREAPGFQSAADEWGAAPPTIREDQSYEGEGGRGRTAPGGGGGDGPNPPGAGAGGGATTPTGTQGTGTTATTAYESLSSYASPDDTVKNGYDDAGAAAARAGAGVHGEEAVEVPVPPPAPTGVPVPPPPAPSPPQRTRSRESREEQAAAPRSFSRDEDDHDESQEIHRPEFNPSGDPEEGTGGGEGTRRQRRGRGGGGGGARARSRSRGPLILSVSRSHSYETEGNASEYDYDADFPEQQHHQQQQHQDGHHPRHQDMPTMADNITPSTSGGTGTSSSRGGTDGGGSHPPLNPTFSNGSSSIEQGQQQQRQSSVNPAFSRLGAAKAPEEEAIEIYQTEDEYTTGADDDDVSYSDGDDDAGDGEGEEGSEYSDSIDGTSPAVIAQVSELLNFVYGKTSVPGQIDRVSTIMRAYEGRENVLLELLETKALIKANSVNEAPPPAAAARAAAASGGGGAGGGRDDAGGVAGRPTTNADRDADEISSVSGMSSTKFDVKVPQKSESVSPMGSPVTREHVEIDSPQKFPEMARQKENMPLDNRQAISSSASPVDNKVEKKKKGLLKKIFGKGKKNKHSHGGGGFPDMDGASPPNNKRPPKKGSLLGMEDSEAEI